MNHCSAGKTDCQIAQQSPNRVSQPLCVLAALSQPQVEITGLAVKINVKIPTYVFCIHFHCYSNENSSQDAGLSDTD